MCTLNGHFVEIRSQIKRKKVPLAGVYGGDGPLGSVCCCPSPCHPPPPSSPLAPPLLFFPFINAFPFAFPPFHGERRGAKEVAVGPLHPLLLPILKEETINCLAPLHHIPNIRLKRRRHLGLGAALGCFCQMCGA